MTASPQFVVIIKSVYLKILMMDENVNSLPVEFSSELTRNVSGRNLIWRRQKIRNRLWSSLERINRFIRRLDLPTFRFLLQVLKQKFQTLETVKRIFQYN